MIGSNRAKSSTAGREYTRPSVLRLTWPFLLTIALSLALAVFSMKLMSAARAFVTGESLWSKAQKDAVLRLADHARSCNPADYVLYEQALSVNLGDRRARQAMDANPPDIEAARQGFLQGLNEPGDIDDMIWLYRRFGNVSFMREAVEIWIEGDRLIDELRAHAAELRELTATACTDRARINEVMYRILLTDDQLAPVERAFSETLGRANRIVQALTVSSLILLTLVLSGVGLWFAARVLRDYDEVSRSREAAIGDLRRLLEAGVAPQDSHGGAPGADPLARVAELVARMFGQIQLEREHLSAIFELSPDAFVSFDEHLRINHVNQAFVLLTGLPEAAVLGLSEDALLQRLRGQMADGGALEPLRQLRQELHRGDEGGGRSRALRIELTRPAVRVLELQLRLGRHPQISQVLVLRDVTHETEVDRIKSEFLSTAAHELRTPMASIAGFSELLLMREFTPDRRAELMQTINRQAQRMSAIVDELLDLARIEARRGQDFVIEGVDLRDVALEAVHDLKVPEGRGAPRWSPGSADAPVAVDRGKLLQALTNVLSNAYKYSPGGGEVEVEVVHRPFDDRDLHRVPHVGVRVRDHGIGMTPAELARVGERFFRADTSGRIPGTGLGMSIVQEIVQLLGGRMDIRSESGAGTEVTLWLPTMQQEDDDGDLRGGRAAP